MVGLHSAFPGIPVHGAESHIASRNASDFPGERHATRSPCIQTAGPPVVALQILPRSLNPKSMSQGGHVRLNKIWPACRHSVCLM